ncbi:MAG: hypothetical protein PHH54_01500 [Candidatus Nanoarchaeia archaeon]|nr:hypothetical protein [Candidatus Nanoarchaeia archaeon]MDD5740639.1 hypothetical protein [Candidatus Nanoarchaeia archaeon]
MNDAIALPAKELISRYKQITSTSTALSAIGENLLEELSDSYKGLELKCNNHRYDTYTQFRIIQRIPLEKPAAEKHFFGLIKKTIVDEERILIHLHNTYYINRRDNDCIRVMVNEKPVIDACNKICEATGRKISLELCF